MASTITTRLAEYGKLFKLSTWSWFHCDWELKNTQETFLKQMFSCTSAKGKFFLSPFPTKCDGSLYILEDLTWEKFKMHDLLKILDIKLFHWQYNSEFSRYLLRFYIKVFIDIWVLNYEKYFLLRLTPCIVTHYLVINL